MLAVNKISYKAQLFLILSKQFVNVKLNFFLENRIFKFGKKLRIYTQLDALHHSKKLKIIKKRFNNYDIATRVFEQKMQN